MSDDFELVEPCPAALAGVVCQLEAGHDGAHMTTAGYPFPDGDRD